MDATMRYTTLGNAKTAVMAVGFAAVVTCRFLVKMKVLSVPNLIEPTVLLAIITLMFLLALAEMFMDWKQNS